MSTNTYQSRSALTAIGLAEMIQGQAPPRGLFDADLGQRFYRNALEVARAVDDADLDFVSLSEHHSFPGLLQPNPALYAAALSQVVKKAGIAWVGPIVSIHNPIRIAEEIAMLDQMLGPNRLTVYLLKGTPNEHLRYGYSPDEARERGQEAALFIKKALTEPDPFDWEGKHWQFKNVSIWPGVTTRPHPLLYTSGSGPETVKFAADNGFGIAIHGGDVKWAKTTVQMYRDACDNAGWRPTSNHVIARGACAIGESDAHAEELKTRMSAQRDLEAYSAETIGSAEHGASARGNTAVLFPFMLHGGKEAAIEQAWEFARAGVGVADLIMQFGGLPHDEELAVIKRLGEVATAVRGF
ncbi:MAG TPA: LLM class flavin-dependent oxidoreductase [Caulobacteraceae bacterium]